MKLCRAITFFVFLRSFLNETTRHFQQTSFPAGNVKVSSTMDATDTFYVANEFTFAATHVAQWSRKMLACPVIGRALSDDVQLCQDVCVHISERSSIWLLSGLENDSANRCEPNENKVNKINKLSFSPVEWSTCVVAGGGGDTSAARRCPANQRTRSVPLCTAVRSAPPCRARVLRVARSFSRRFASRQLSFSTSRQQLLSASFNCSGLSTAQTDVASLTFRNTGFF